MIYFNFFLCLNIVIGVIVSLYLIYNNRYKPEKDFKQIEIVMDYQDIKEISFQANISEFEALQILKESGLTTVLLRVIDYEQIKIAHSLGLWVVVQIHSKGNMEFYDILEKIPNLSAVIFADKNIPGCPNYLHQLATKIQKNNLRIGVIEFFHQDNFIELCKLIKNKVIRFHTLLKTDFKRYIPSEVLFRYVLASYERNHRALIIRVPIPKQSINPVSYYKSFLQKMQIHLKRKGFTIGKASTLPLIPEHKPLKFFVGLCIISVDMLLLEKLIGGDKFIFLLFLTMIFFGFCH